MKNSKPHELHFYRWLMSLIVVLLFLPGPAFSLPFTERVTLQNGLRIIVSEVHSLPFVTFQLIIDGGSRVDPPGKKGLAYMTAKGLLHGTTRHTAQQMSSAIDSLGANLSSHCSKDYTSVGLRVLKKDLVHGFNLFMDAVTQPVFPEDEHRREIQRTLGAIKSAEEDPGELAEREFFKTLFAASPYGHPVMGTEESIATLTHNDLKSFHNTYIRPNHAILVIVGDISLDEIKKSLLGRLEMWPAMDVPKFSYEQTPTPRAKVLTIDRAITQANVVLGNLGPQRNNPDFFPMVVMNYILGSGSFSSRLLTEVRAKHGFAYSIHSVFDFRKHAGLFRISFQTKNDSARKAISIVLEEMKKIQKDPVTDKELDGARKYLTGSFPLRLDTQAKLAAFLAQVEYYDLGHDYADNYASRIMAVTKEDVQRVAQKYLHPDNYTLVVVGSLKEVNFRE